MKGYKVMADSYRQLMKENKISDEEGLRKLRVYDFLTICDEEDLQALVNSSALNDIFDAYFRYAIKKAEVNESDKKKILEVVDDMLHHMRAEEILNEVK